MGANNVVAIVLKLTDQFSVPLARAKAALKPLEEMKQSAEKAGRSVRNLAMGWGAVGAGGAFLFKRQFFDVASQFEQFGVVLETLEGSKEKAKKSLDWVNDFAVKTPFQLAEVTDAFVTLRSIGIDPTNGALRIVGDAASARNKSMAEMTQVLLSGVAGENEVLRRYGIFSQVKGNWTQYQYKDREGRTRHQVVNNKDVNAMAAAITAIWDKMYGGGMERMSHTAKGIISNLLDQWTRFTNKVMENGAFNSIKTKLEGLLATVDNLSASGKLQRIAEMWGGKVARGIEVAWNLAGLYAKRLMGILEIVDKFANLIGGYDRLLALMVGASTIQAIVNVGKLALAMKEVAIAMGMANAASGWLGALATVMTLLYFGRNPIETNNENAPPTMNKVGGQQYPFSRGNQHVTNIDIKIDSQGRTISTVNGLDNAVNTNTWGPFFTPLLNPAR